MKAVPSNSTFSFVRTSEGKRKLIAFLTDGFVVRKILLHLGLDSEPPHLAPARALEESVFAW